jgi:GNAT superfamily N-acetyltransferase
MEKFLRIPLKISIPETSEREEYRMHIRNMERGDLDEAVALLVVAFQNSPFYTYIAPDETERKEFLTVNFRHRLEGGLGLNETEILLPDDRKIAAIAVWIPPVVPGKEPVENPSLEDALSVFSGELQERFFAFLGTLTGARERIIQQPFWSLAPIAVLPENRGKGLASVLIRKKLKKIDASALPCFLGTQDRINLTIYAKYGFKEVREDPLALPDIIHYSMIRN